MAEKKDAQTIQQRIFSAVAEGLSNARPGSRQGAVAQDAWLRAVHCVNEQLKQFTEYEGLRIKGSR